MDLAYLARNAAPAERARSRILRSGFTISGHKIWTEDEDLVCRIFYPDYFAICRILDTRSKKAIQTRSQKLGLVPPRQSWQWLARQQLRKLYPEASREEIRDNFPGVEWQKIQSAARYYGYRRKKKPYKITGVVPSIKAEADATISNGRCAISTRKLAQSGIFNARLSQQIPQPKSHKSRRASTRRPPRNPMG